MEDQYWHRFAYLVWYSLDGEKGAGYVFRDQPITDLSNDEIGDLLAGEHGWPIGSVTVLNIELKRSPDQPGPAR